LLADDLDMLYANISFEKGEETSRYMRMGDDCYEGLIFMKSI